MYLFYCVSLFSPLNLVIVWKMGIKKRSHRNVTEVFVMLLISKNILFAMHYVFMRYCKTKNYCSKEKFGIHFVSSKLCITRVPCSVCFQELLRRSLTVHSAHLHTAAASLHFPVSAVLECSTNLHGTTCLALCMQQQWELYIL